MDILIDTIKKVAIDNTIIITFANFAYKDVILNWAAGIKRLNIRNYIVISLDEYAYDYFAKNNITTVLKPFTGNIDELWIFRMKIFNQVIENDFDLLHSDADAIWLKNPLPEFFSDKSYDMTFSQGTVYPPDVKNDWGFVLCCGLFLIRSNQTTKSIFGEINNNIMEVKDDQVAVNRYLRDNFDIKWTAKPGTIYGINVFGTTITCSHEIITGITKNTDQSNKSEHPIKIAVLPHHLFQRVHLEHEDAYVKHILSQKNYKSKLDMFKQTGCLFIDN